MYQDKTLKIATDPAIKPQESASGNILRVRTEVASPLLQDEVVMALTCDTECRCALLVRPSSQQRKYVQVVFHLLICPNLT
jgi:hypothetical protein